MYVCMYLLYLYFYVKIIIISIYRDDSKNDVVKLRDMKLVMKDMKLRNDRRYAILIFYGCS